MSESTVLPIANNQKRALAFVIDDMIVTFLFIAIFYTQLSEIFLHITVVDEATIRAIKAFITQHILILFAIKILYHAILIWQGGMTPGKYVAKIKVVELEVGHTPRFERALLRACVRILSETLFYLGFILAFFVPLKQTLHDKLSGCVVIDV